MIIDVSDIDWDTDGDEVDLPTEMTIDLVAEKIDNPSEVANWLSDRYGYCVAGFSHEPAPARTPEAAPAP